MFTSASRRLQSIVLSRYFLDLRGIYLSPPDDCWNSKLSSLHFASRIVGNLAAPIGSRISQDEEGFESVHDEDEVEEIQFAPNPFVDGLRM